MLAQDLVRFGIIYSIFIMGYSQAYYIIFSGYEDDEEDNPLETPVESFILMFIMSLGEFGDLWDTFDSTKHSTIGIFGDTLFTASHHFVCSEGSVVCLHVPSGHSPVEPADRHDGRHLRQDCGDQERVDETVGPDGLDNREVHPTQGETQAAKQVRGGRQGQDLTELPPGCAQVLRYRHPGEQGPGDEAVLGG